jgi:hypothetical protein
MHLRAVPILKKLRYYRPFAEYTRAIYYFYLNITMCAQQSCRFTDYSSGVAELREASLCVSAGNLVENVRNSSMSALGEIIVLRRVQGGRAVEDNAGDSVRTS